MVNPSANYAWQPLSKATAQKMLCVERHGYRGFDQPKYSPQLAVTAQRVLESFRRRRREFATDDEGIAHHLDIRE